MQNNKKNIIDHFDNLAKYRSSWIKKSYGFYSEDIRVMKEIIPQNSKILEIGCGTGHLIAALKPSYGVGIDISEKMIDEAKTDFKNIDFIHGDIENANIFQNIKSDFDYIIISDTIGYFIDIEKVLNNIS